MSHRSLIALVVVSGVAFKTGAQVAPSDETDVRGAGFAEAVLKQQAQAALEEATVRRIDKEAFEHNHRFQTGEDGADPAPGPNGRVQFVYGASAVRVFCLAQHFCDIELETDEQVKRGLLSNKTQFVVDSALADRRAHVILQPKAVQATTSLLIYTDRRVYDLEVIATDDPAKHMPKVGFVYPKNDLENWEDAREHEGRLPSAPAEKEYQLEADLDDMHFSYSIKKEGRWRVRRRITWMPERVYDDGERTYIDLPRSILVGERPILLTRNVDGTTAIINYTPKGRHIIVGGLIDEAVLIKGVGWWNQERVRIRRHKVD